MPQALGAPPPWLKGEERALEAGGGARGECSPAHTPDRTSGSGSKNKRATREPNSA